VEDDGFLDLRCPYCGIDLSFPTSTIGTVQECPGCLQVVIIPKNGDTAGKLPVPIATPRIVLRRLKPDDWKDVLEFMSDETLLQYVDWFPLDEQSVADWIEKDRTTRFGDQNTALFLAMEVSALHKVVGWVSVAFSDATRRQAGIAVIVNRQFQRQGYATEALGGLFEFCFKGLNLHRVTAATDTRNPAACAMLEKAGMRREGEFLEDHFTNGEWISTAYYGLLLREQAERIAGGMRASA
jgi:RimJ/RimL family protein N-acetyltransferase